MTRLLAAIVTLAMLTPSVALAQSKPIGPGGSCPHGYTSSASYCVGPTPNGEGYYLNFANAPIATVAKVILGDLLGVGYTIDPRVQGTVSLSSGRPVPKPEVLFLLENALSLSNVALVHDVSGYRLMPVSEAKGTGQLDVRR
jgi:general secretion pathway protein D